MAHIRLPCGHLKFLGHVVFSMLFQHRCRSFKCFSVLLASVAVIFIYNALIEPKLRHTAYVILLRRLEILLNNFTGPPACNNTEQLTASYQYTLCREWSYGKLPRKITRVISVENDNFQFENELEAEFDNIKFFVFSTNESELDIQNVKNFHIASESWLKYVLWVPYFGWKALLSTFRRFLLESSMPEPSYAIFKMGNLHGILNPWFLGEIIDEEKFQTFHQLHIQIKTERGNPAVIQQWMVVIGKLQKHGYHLFKTKLGDGDGNTDEPCFFTSWIKLQKQQPVKAMINPLDPNVNLEERLRDLLAEPTVNCNRKITITVSTVEDNRDSSTGSALQWPVCVEEMRKPCIVYSAKFGGPETFETSMANLGCTVYLFDPTLNVSDERRGPEKQIRALSLGLGTVNAKVVSGLDKTDSTSFLTYVKANEMAAKLNHQNVVIDVLRLDLHGGEWDVLQNLVSNQQIENYHQIVVTIHIWHGEEVFSLIDRFMRLQKLLNAGFEVFYSHSADNNLAHDEQQKHGCCFVVGWLKVT